MNTSVEQLVGIEAAFRQAIEQQDWACIESLDQECRKIVEDALLAPPADDLAFREKLRELLALYQDMLIICHAEQERLGKELLHFSQSQQGAKVYKLFG